MASGDQFAFLRPPDFNRGDGFPGDLVLRPTNRLSGVPLGKAGDECGIFQVWSNGSPLATGITIGIALADDPENSNPGGSVVIGVSCKKILSGNDDGTVPLAANEVTATLTISATPGVMTVSTIAIPNAKLASLAAGNTAMLRIRRVGANAADTHTGRVLLLYSTVKDT